MLRTFLIIFLWAGKRTSRF